MDVISVKTTEDGYLLNEAHHVPSDPNNADNKAIQAWIAAGNTPEPYVKPVVNIVSITKEQAYLQAVAMSIWPMLKAAISNNDDFKDYWDVATTLRIDNPLVKQMSQQLGVDLEIFFNAAGEIQ